MAVRRLLGAVLIVSLLKLSTGQVVPYKEEFFDQTIDHFNFVSYGDKTFKQRYLIQGKASIQRRFSDRHDTIIRILISQVKFNEAW